MKKPPMLVPAEVAAELNTLSKACLMDLAWDLIGIAHGEAHRDADPFESIALFLSTVVHARGDKLQRLAGTANLRAAMDPHLSQMATADHQKRHADEIAAAEADVENFPEAPPVDPEVAAEAEEEIRRALAAGDQARLAAASNPEMELAMRIAREEGAV